MFCQVPFTPWDSLAGDQSLHMHRALAPSPANLSAQCPSSQLDHRVPPHVRLCLFSMQNVVPVGEGDLVDVPQDSESQLQEQEKRIEISCALATEASRRGRMLSGERGWASLRQGDRLTVYKGGGTALRQSQGQRDTGPGRYSSKSDGHLLSTMYCARLRGAQGPELLACQRSEP